jgi:hypothetical protein
MLEVTDCILRAGGKRFDADVYLKHCNFKNYVVHRKNDKISKRKTIEDSISIVVSTNKKLDTQFKSILSFLEKRKKEILYLKHFQGVDSIYLDIGIFVPHPFGVLNIYFMSELITKISASDIGLNISLYQSSK